MDQSLLQLINVAAGGFLGITSGLLTTWVNNQYHDRRHRRELDSRARQHKDERRSSFAHTLLDPRIKAHEELFGRLYDLQIAAHYFIVDRNNTDYATEYRRAKNAFRIVCGLNRIWVRTPALETLTAIDKELDTLEITNRRGENLFPLFNQAVERLYWSVGLEDLEFYQRELWGAEVGEK